MRKTTELWPVTKLAEHFTRINFPEYQREPNIWSLDMKQRLIDSMLRQFDIAPIYFYVNDDDSIDCVDGRQRIGAIMSFLEKNPSDDDDGFDFKPLNEIYKDLGLFAPLKNSSFLDLEKEAEITPLARRLVDEFRGYEITIVKLSGSGLPQEFNLQFTRLNVGTVINSGEMLHAMVGDLRNVCFDDIGQHAFLEMTRIPTRRYARQQVAAQILAEVFSIEQTGEFTRTRHVDLQRLFFDHSTLSEERKRLIERTRSILDLLEKAFDELGILRNRAITISTVLLAWRGGGIKEEEAGQLAGFMQEFLCRLQWQVRKGLDFDDEYRYLLDFQRNVTQASVEKPALEARAETLEREYARWREESVLLGDVDYRARTSIEPGRACRGEE